MESAKIYVYYNPVLYEVRSIYNKYQPSFIFVLKFFLENNRFMNQGDTRCTIRRTL